VDGHGSDDEDGARTAGLAQRSNIEILMQFHPARGEKVKQGAEGESGSNFPGLKPGGAVEAFANELHEAGGSHHAGGSSSEESGESLRERVHKEEREDAEDHGDIGKDGGPEGDGKESEKFGVHGGLVWGRIMKAWVRASALNRPSSEKRRRKLHAPRHLLQSVHPSMV